SEIGGVPAVAVAASANTGLFCSPVNPDGYQLISGPPADLFLTENDPVNLAVVASVVPPSLLPYFSYLWQRSNALSGVFTNVPGVTGSVLAFNARLSDDGAAYRVTPTANPNIVFTTRLHVVRDTNAPFMVAASSLNGTNIDICYNE